MTGKTEAQKWEEKKAEFKEKVAWKLNAVLNKRSADLLAEDILALAKAHFGWI